MGACEIQVRHGEASRGDHSVLMPYLLCCVPTLALAVGSRVCLPIVLQRHCTRLSAHCMVSAQPDRSCLESFTLLLKSPMGCCG